MLVESALAEDDRVVWDLASKSGLITVNEAGGIDGKVLASLVLSFKDVFLF